MTRSNITIYCDGGLGNRLNALLSGMAIARYFKLNYTIHWPINHSCAANYSDIFRKETNVSNESLIQVKSRLANHAILLHDDIASDVLNVKFSSAYQYSSLVDFNEKIISQGQDIFFYPAIIPSWIPAYLIQAEMNALQFTDYINAEVETFILTVIGKPFHGLHLRRTDLNIGLTDLEVFKIAQANPDCAFFVCSDDPQAERLASGHPNVFSRSKSSYVQKKHGGDDWLALLKDEDGRSYYSNIQRDKESVIDGAIDMLILSHSQIVGFSGSTFQTMARNLGQYWSKLNWVKPEALEVFPMREIQRQVESATLPIEAIIHVSNIWAMDPMNKQPLTMISKLMDRLKGEDLLNLLFAFAQFAERDGLYYLATVYLNEIIRYSPTRRDPIIMLERLNKKLRNI